MQKMPFFTGAFAAALIFAALPLCAQPPSPQRRREPMGPPKNLQVLPKNISHDDLIKTMHGFTGGLGVKCTFCHVMDSQSHHIDFASDAKPEKRTARTMLRMTEEINGKYLSQVHVADVAPDQTHVSCGTCHRDHEIPAAFIPPPEHEHGMPHGMLSGGLSKGD